MTRPRIIVTGATEHRVYASDGTGALGRTFLRVGSLCVRRDWGFGGAPLGRGELALPLIRDDLLSGSSLL